MPTYDEQRRRFGAILASRRRELGLTHAAVRKAGGPSTATFIKLEKGDTAKPDYQTLRKIDHAMQWASGSAQRAFDRGDDPQALPSDHQFAQPPLDSQVSPTRPVVALDNLVLIRTSLLTEVIGSVQGLEDVARRSKDSELDSIVSTLNGFVDRIVRAWIIAQVEGWKDRDELGSNEVLISRMLGDYLAREPKAESASDAFELGYLRWLLGRETSGQFADSEYETAWSNRL